MVFCCWLYYSRVTVKYCTRVGYLIVSSTFTTTSPTAHYKSFLSNITFAPSNVKSTTLSSRKRYFSSNQPKTSLLHSKHTCIVQFVHPTEMSGNLSSTCPSVYIIKKKKHTKPVFKASKYS